MVVIVSGGRNYKERSRVFEILDKVHTEIGKITVLKHGACPTGADAYASDWAQSTEGVQEKTFPANWNKLGKSAGPIRNADMIRSGADFVILFPGGKGTGDCRKKAKMAGIPIIEGD